MKKKTPKPKPKAKKKELKMPAIETAPLANEDTASTNEAEIQARRQKWLDLQDFCARERITRVSDIEFKIAEIDREIANRGQ